MIGHALIALAPLIRRFEGLHKLRNGMVYPYLCPAGYWTHGYGKLCSKDTPPITPLEAEQDMQIIMPGYLFAALKMAPRLWLQPPEVMAAIADFVYNLGEPRFRSSTLRKRINEGDWEGALRELPKWKFGGGKVLPGLVLRRAAEAALIKKSLGLP